MAALTGAPDACREGWPSALKTKTSSSSTRNAAYLPAKYPSMAEEEVRAERIFVKCEEFLDRFDTAVEKHHKILVKLRLIFELNDLSIHVRLWSTYLQKEKSKASTGVRFMHPYAWSTLLLHFARTPDILTQLEDLLREAEQPGARDVNSDSEWKDQYEDMLQALRLSVRCITAVPVDMLYLDRPPKPDLPVLSEEPAVLQEEALLSSSNNEVKRDAQKSQVVVAKATSNAENGRGITTATIPSPVGSTTLEPSEPMSSQASRKVNLPTMPQLSVADAREWRNNRGTHDSLGKGQRWTFLNARDHIFVVDDSTSMKPFWSEMSTLLDLLAYMTKDCDSGVVELSFLANETRVKSTHPLDLVRQVKKVTLQGRVDARPRMSQIIERYRSDLKDHRGRVDTSRQAKSRRSLPATSRSRQQTGVRPLNIYVMTTGAWQPGSELDDIMGGLVQDLVQYDLFASPVGIQFIRFGDDDEGFKRLADLKISLSFKIGIVDTVSSEGNVWRMLLGTVNPWCDDPDPLARPL